MESCSAWRISVSSPPWLTVLRWMSSSSFSWCDYIHRAHVCCRTRVCYCSNKLIPFRERAGGRANLCLRQARCKQLHHPPSIFTCILRFPFCSCFTLLTFSVHHATHLPALNACYNLVQVSNTHTQILSVKPFSVFFYRCCVSCEYAAWCHARGRRWLERLPSSSSCFNSERFLKRELSQLLRHTWASPCVLDL